MKKYFQLLAIISSIFLISCDPNELTLKVNNPDRIPVYLYRLYDQYVSSIPNYWITDCSINPPTSFNLMIGEGLGDERAVFNIFVPDGFVSLRIVHPDTVKKYPIETILSKHLTMCEYELSYDDLVSFGWEITLFE